MKATRRSSAIPHGWRWITAFAGTFLLLGVGEGYGLPSRIDCGALPSAEYFRTDPPTLRSRVVKASVPPFPRWSSSPKIFVSSALGPAAEQSELQEPFRLAGRDLTFVRDSKLANFTIFAYFNFSSKNYSPGVLCMQCVAPHPIESEFDIVAGLSPLTMRSLDMGANAPKGQEMTERYWPFDHMTFLWKDREKGPNGNVPGSMAVNRRMEIIAAECWINIDLPVAVQASLISECAVRALGFPAIGSSATLRVWAEAARKSTPVAKIDEQARRCISELYGDK